MEITRRVIRGKREGENKGKGTENKKHKWQVENRQGDVKTSIGNGEAKVLICMTHERELRGECWQEWGTGQGALRREKDGTTVIA